MERGQLWAVTSRSRATPIGISWGKGAGAEARQLSRKKVVFSAPETCYANLLTRLCRLIRHNLDRFELRQPNFVRCLLELHGDFHAELYLFHRAADDIGDQARALVEIDPGDNIRDIFLKGL